VGGVEIPNAKRVETSLTYIHGVGGTTARQILLDVGIENKITKELSEEELTTIRDEVSKYMVEGDLVSDLGPSYSNSLSCHLEERFRDEMVLGFGGWGAYHAVDHV